MYLLVLILNKEEYLEDILTAFVEAGLTGATIIDSVGMGRVLAYDIPIFAGLRQALEGYKTKPYNKTILTVVSAEVKLKKAIELTEKIINLNEPGTGLLFVLPVLDVRGLASKELEL